MGRTYSNATSNAHTRNVGSSGSKRTNNYFCTHWKIHGHSLERCFKIHGYPANVKNFKDKRVVVVSHNSTGAEASETVNSSANSPITASQYQQLIMLLTK